MADSDSLKVLGSNIVGALLETLDIILFAKVHVLLV